MNMKGIATLGLDAESPKGRRHEAERVLQPAIDPPPKPIQWFSLQAGLAFDVGRQPKGDGDDFTTIMVMGKPDQFLIPGRGDAVFDQVPATFWPAVLLGLQCTCSNATGPGGVLGRGAGRLVVVVLVLVLVLGLG